MKTMNLGEGLKRLQKGDVNGAIEAFLVDIEKHPDNLDLPMMLATVLVQAGKYSTALDVLSAVLAKDPDHEQVDGAQLDEYTAEALIGWAHQIEEEGFSKKAVDAFIAAVEAYADAGFSDYLSELMAVEAAVRHRQPVLIDFESKSSEDDEDDE